MEMRIARLLRAMIRFDEGDVARIQHFVKVHDFAAAIGKMENLDTHTQQVLEAAAVLHDIGIHPSERIYGNDNGKHQEELGPGEARRLLEESADFSPCEIDRICHLVGHHHTYSGVDGPDWQILLEADFLVNSFENNLHPESVAAFRDKVFRTPTGTELLNTMWRLNGPLDTKSSTE